MARLPATPHHIACLGGGHGLFQTLLAARDLDSEKISAIVTVADDGGSSGRLRRELDLIPPGDLRMALAALADDGEQEGLWATTLQHRFGGSGALAGHAVGNLLIAGLTEVVGEMQEALDIVARLTRSHGRVYPVVEQPLDIEAEVAGLDEDPTVMRPVRGQVAVATTPGNVRRVRILPQAPAANPAALEALSRADFITLGPGSWFTSVIPHVLVPDIVDAINASSAPRVVVLNLSAEPGETHGFSAERHVQVLAQHAAGLHIDWIVVDSAAPLADTEKKYLQRAADSLGATVIFAEVSAQDEDGERRNVHDPAKLARVFGEIYRGEV
ncbi:uridine diphosphate-N-acetylglucosamine-binding protein YvcK [Corynebacterium phoceense]|uniref:gluconeogenesis factor YvcK family protein n=1 Tax=Corynebacterium phoceense TaxID=1686286 RepID=UPI00211BB1A6|nr:uridine diphosphate-N-acetylglucosamine-binding protein YvcK [Corynebacterium phoceense]MCQ9332638.1 uridine diphosphate-N-acetylglucosamine-binding protein YvcK [Corynebacterium phoceense]